MTSIQVPGSTGPLDDVNFITAIAYDDLDRPHLQVHRTPAPEYSRCRSVRCRPATWEQSHRTVDQLRRATHLIGGVVQGSEEYWYGRDGTRSIVLKRDASGAELELIWFIGGQETHYAPGGAVTSTNVYVSLGGSIGRVHRETGGTTSLEYLFHGLGENTIAAVDAPTGAVNASFSYAPFGELLETTDSGGANGVDGHRHRMNDKYVDELTDLAYYGARYYDKTSMTWTQADPLYRFVPDLSKRTPRRAGLYEFSLNNPLRYLDPDGHDTKTDRTGGHPQINHHRTVTDDGGFSGGVLGDSSFSSNTGATSLIDVPSPVFAPGWEDWEAEFEIE
jgi:RHS repeat-associated protein